MKNHFLLVLLVFSCVFTGCKDDSPGDPEDLHPQYEVKTGEYTFYASLEKYQEANTRRGDEDYCGVPAEIQKVSRKANTLTIDISRPGSYIVNYEIIWDGNIMESYPMMASIFIRAIPEDRRDLTGTTTDVLVVDLEKTLKDVDASTLQEINFMVKEACSRNNIKCLEDCDVPVSN